MGSWLVFTAFIDEETFKYLTVDTKVMVEPQLSIRMICAMDIFQFFILGGIYSLALCINVIIMHFSINDITYMHRFCSFGGSFYKLLEYQAF